MIPLPRIFERVYADAENEGGKASRALETVKSVVRTPESELKRWRRVFEANAKTVTDGERCVIPRCLSIHASMMLTSRLPFLLTTSRLVTILPHHAF